MSRTHPPVVISREHSPHRVKHKFWRGVGDIVTLGGISAVTVPARRAENAAYNAHTRHLAAQHDARRDREQEARHDR